MAVPPKFDRPGFSDGLTLANADGRFGFFSADGKCVIDLKERHVESAWVYTEGLAKFKQGDKYGYFDKQGKIAVPPEFDWLGPFVEGLAAFRKGGKFGFVDKRGTVEVPAEFNRVWPYSEGLAAAMKNDRWGFIDRKGAFVIEPRFSNVRSFSNGLAAVNTGGWIAGQLMQGGETVEYIAKGGQNAYIDRSGRVVIQPAAEWLFDFVDDTALINRGGKFDQHGNVEGGKWGLVDKSGHLVVEPAYSSMHSLGPDCFAVRQGEVWGVVDAKGKSVIQPGFSEIYHFSEGLACVLAAGKYRYIDSTGRFAFEQSFFVAGDFVDGIAPASADGAVYGFVDSKGSWAIPPEFGGAGYFSEGFAIVRFVDKTKPLHYRQFGHLCRNGRLYGSQTVGEGPNRLVIPSPGMEMEDPRKVTFIDRKGARVTPRHFDDAKAFEQGLGAVKVNGQWGYLARAE